MQTLDENLIPKRFLGDGCLSSCTPVKQHDQVLAWRVESEEAEEYSRDDFPFDKHSADDTAHRVFQFVCKSCSSKEVTRHEHTELTSAFAVRCRNCELETLIHFAGEHGYDAQVNRDSPSEDLPKILSEVACGKCDDMWHELVIEMLFLPESLSEALESDPMIEAEEAYEGIHLFSKCLSCDLVSRWVSEACS